MNVEYYSTFEQAPPPDNTDFHTENVLVILISSEVGEASPPNLTRAGAMDILRR